MSLWCPKCEANGEVLDAAWDVLDRKCQALTARVAELEKDAMVLAQHHVQDGDILGATANRIIDLLTPADGATSEGKQHAPR